MFTPKTSVVVSPSETVGKFKQTPVSESGNAVIFIPSIVIAEALSVFDKKRVTFLSLLNLPA
jgi:hypothetical protein